MTTARQTQVRSLIARAAQPPTARRTGRGAKDGETADLVVTLATALCPVAHGPPVAVADVIDQDAGYYEHAAALEAQGVALTADRRGRRGSFRAGKTAVFVDPQATKCRLLTDARWSARDVARVLLGIAGAVRRQRSLGGRRRWGIEVPLAAWATIAEAERAGVPHTLALASSWGHTATVIPWRPVRQTGSRTPRGNRTPKGRGCGTKRPRPSPSEPAPPSRQTRGTRDRGAAGGRPPPLSGR